MKYLAFSYKLDHNPEAVFTAVVPQDFRFPGFNVRDLTAVELVEVADGEADGSGSEPEVRAAVARLKGDV